MAAMLAVFVSILAEQMAVERHLEVLERREVDGFPLTVSSFADSAVVVCRTGMAARRGSVGADVVLNEFTPGAVLSARMACSFSDAARIGDLVLCGKSYLRLAGGPVSEPPAEADQRLLTLARQAADTAGLPYTLGNTLTAEFGARDLAERRGLGEELDIAVFDANGHFLAEAARERGIPFLSVRVAMGRAFEAPPDSLGLTAERGVLRARGALAYCLRRPTRFPGFLRLFADVRRGYSRLSAFSRAFLREWSLEP
jgi:nucleoside phosphorylase